MHQTQSYKVHTVLPNWVYSLDWSSQDAKLDLILFTINFGKIVTDLGVMVLLDS